MEFNANFNTDFADAMQVREEHAGIWDIKDPVSHYYGHRETELNFVGGE